jgi:hypothetical protein
MISSISLQQLFQLKELKKTFLILYYPTWLKNRSYVTDQNWLTNNILFPLQDSIGKKLRTVVLWVDTNHEAENYVLNTLSLSSLPYIELYSYGTLISAWNSVDDITSPFDWMIDFEENKETPSNVIEVLFRNGQEKTSLTKDEMNNKKHAENETEPVLEQAEKEDEEKPFAIFISGDRSSVGKSTICLSILAYLIEKKGVSPSSLAYIKPVTQCEAEQPVAKYCREKGITSEPIGPVVFYQGLSFYLVYSC